MSLRLIVHNSSGVVATGLISLISGLSNIPLYMSTTSLLSIFSFQGHLGYIQVEAVNVGVPVSCRFLFFPRYTPMSASALCSVAHFLDVLINTIHFSRVAIGNLDFHYQPHRAPFSPRPVYTLWGWLFWLMRSDTFCSIDFQCPPVLLAKKGVCPFLEYIQKKRIRPLWPTASQAMFSLFSCALMESPFYLFKSLSCHSPLLTSPFRWLTSRHFSTVDIFNSAVSWILVPLSSIFQLVFLGTGHKTAGFPQALFCFRGQS